MKNKLAGVTLDWYDDELATLKAKFPSADQLPEIVKTADIRPADKLANEQFALVALNEGHVLRKYACHDPGTTAMSVIYFMEHGDKLPDEAQKVAAANLVAACQQHELIPPMALEKAAMEKVSADIDITGQSPKPKVKLARPQNDEDYAVVLQDGSRHYPIDTWDRVKLAEDYYQENRLRMEPRVRRQYAVKLAAKAIHLGYPLDYEIFEKGACTYASPTQMRAAIEMRKVACAPGEEREWLDELFEKRASMEPGAYAACLHRFDVENSLDRGWDQVVLDPWESTFGIDKTAKVVWEQGADRVTDDQLQTLAQNQHSGLQELFNEEFTKQFIRNPTDIFNSMPDPQKKIIARLANDLSSQGGSEVAVVG